MEILENTLSIAYNSTLMERFDALKRKVAEKFKRKEPELKTDIVRKTVEDLYGKLIVPIFPQYYEHLKEHRKDESNPDLIVNLINEHYFRVVISPCLPYPTDKKIRIEVRESEEQAKPTTVINIEKSQSDDNVDSFSIGENKNTASAAREIKKIIREMETVVEEEPLLECSNYSSSF